MAARLNSSGISFNDGTAQNTAGGAVNTTTVLSATAGATTGSVGTYGLFRNVWGGTISPNQNISGGALRYSNTPGGYTYGPGGTWKCMGFTYNTSPDGITTFLRIS